MMPQNLPAFRERKLRFDASKAVRFSRIRHCINASLPQNRVRFSRPVKKNQGLTIVAKAEKTLSAYWLPRRRRKGSGGTTPLIAAQETWGSGTASPPASTERDVVVEHAPPRSQEHPSSVTTRRPPSQTLRITSQVRATPTFPPLPDVHTTPAVDPMREIPRGCWSIRRQITPLNQALRTGRTPQKGREIDIDTQITTAPDCRHQREERISP